MARRDRNFWHAWMLTEYRGNPEIITTSTRLTREGCRDGLKELRKHYKSPGWKIVESGCRRVRPIG